MLPLGHCDDGLLSRPDASDELKGSGTSACSASVPSPSPLEFLKWTGSATFKGSIRESISSGIPEWIIPKRRDDG